MIPIIAQVTFNIFKLFFITSHFSSERGRAKMNPFDWMASLPLFINYFSFNLIDAKAQIKITSMCWLVSDSSSDCFADQGKVIYFPSAIYKKERTDQHCNSKLNQNLLHIYFLEDVLSYAKWSICLCLIYWFQWYCSTNGSMDILDANWLRFQKRQSSKAAPKWVWRRCPRTPSSIPPEIQPQF